MPNIEAHVRFCIRTFGEENSELCYMINSWIDGPVRSMGSNHRKNRHDPLLTPFWAIKHYGNMEDGSDPKNLLVARIVLQHLKLDGLIDPHQENTWTSWVNWEEITENTMNLKAKIEKAEQVALYPALLDLLDAESDCYSSSDSYDYQLQHRMKGRRRR